tara:strand:+ start:2095 stop:3009 length:915 start_codon:yes stop_codon:yes gene_type:complete
MSNGFNNPYARTEIGLDDLIFHGDTQRIKSRVKRGSAGQGKWEYTYGYDPYEVNVADMYTSGTGFRPDSLDYITGMAPEGFQTYDYSGLGHIASDALDRVFGDYFLDFGAVDPNWRGEFIHQGAEDEGALRAALEESGELDTYRYSVDPYYGSNYYLTSTPDIAGINLGIKGPGAIDFFDPDSIAHALNVMGGFEEGAGIDPSEVNALNLDVIERQGDAYYEPILEDVKEGATYNLLDSLAKDVTGGFAASAAPQIQRRMADKAFSSSIGKILESILKQKASAGKDILSQIMGYKELLEERKKP